MDIFAGELSFTNTHFGCPASAALVCDKIASGGGEFSRHLISYAPLHDYYHCENFRRELGELNMFPEQFERK